MAGSKFMMALIGLLVSAQTAWAGPNCADVFRDIQGKHKLVELARVKNPPRYLFIKDAPTLAYRITSGRFEDIPAAIARHLGSVDRTKYTPEYLSENIGSVFALQMNGDKPDFYVIGKAAFAKYAAVPADQVAQKNAKYLGRLAQQIPDLIDAGDPNLIAVLKMSPVPMIKMSDLGYSLNAEVVIESPWGDQTKPAGQDAYLVYDESKQQYYMVNTDSQGLPLSYVPAR